MPTDRKKTKEFLSKVQGGNEKFLSSTDGLAKVIYERDAGAKKKKTNVLSCIGAVCRWRSCAVNWEFLILGPKEERPKVIYFVAEFFFGRRCDVYNWGAAGMEGWRYCLNGFEVGKRLCHFCFWLAGVNVINWGINFGQIKRPHWLIHRRVNRESVDNMFNLLLTNRYRISTDLIMQLCNFYSIISLVLSYKQKRVLIYVYMYSFRIFYQIHNYSIISHQINRDRCYIHH